MRVKPKKNEKVEAWETYVETCRNAKKEYKNRVRVAWTLYQKCLNDLNTNRENEPETQGGV